MKKYREILAQSKDAKFGYSPGNSARIQTGNSRTTFLNSRGSANTMLPILPSMDKSVSDKNKERKEKRKGVTSSNPITGNRKNRPK